ncbi:oligosaccharide flippase family protein [Niallia taxi]|uniref:oligosaccharide flippase family protein n=1 Tax=Niallia taxi TaxID=2499688 RepID=UPI002E1AC780|nr:oligosaccharide flippase family protein [Niallia taxi]MED4054186.1 oligosaccharide flippase family protein [Niallia taxi]MED4118294.1 oligosaccharide flippase family protein [Niallia taxi]
MNSMAKKIGWMLYGQGGRLVFQTIYFLGLAFVFSTSEYGIYVSVTALIVILSPFCGLGFNSLIVKIISTDEKNFPRIFGNTIKITVYTYLALLLIGLSAILLIFNTSRIAIMLFLIMSLADLLLLKFTEMSSQIFIAKGKVKISAHILNFISIVRFLSILIYIILSKLFLIFTGLINWAIVYLICSVLFTIIVFVFTLKKSEKPILRDKIKLHYIREGVYFSIGLSSQGVYNDVDKTLLGKYATLETTGLYGFAYKILDVMFIPVKAILAITFPMFFRAGKEGGILETVKLSKKILIPLTIFTFLISLTAYFIVPLFINEFFYNKYAGSIEIFKLLLPIVILRNIHYILADAITGAGFQKERSIIQIIVAGVNFILNLYLIKTYQVSGAIFASLFCDLLMVLLISILVWYKIKNTKLKNEVYNEIS